MALTELWKTAQKEIRAKHIQQVIGFAGEGKLRDGGPASKELRDFLALVPSSFLSRYAGECLTDKFEGGGFALQDVINEVGKRLGFRVEQGRYRGTPGEVGFDGLWISPDRNALVMEVKTTDAYRIDLDKVASYRRNLIAEQRVKEPNCSILLIVGRSNTGDLEAQVRGSRHAWDIRLISIDGLLRLMQLKEELEDPKMMDKIRRVLMPQEFTKVDGIIDLVFSTAEDVKKEEELAAEADEGEGDQHKPKFTPVNFREACAARVEDHLRQSLVKRSFAIYSSPDEKLLVICINSREYRKATYSDYWFAFHPHQRDLLQSYQQAFVALGCGSKESILLIPAMDFVPWLDRCHRTESEDRFYWHVRVTKGKDGYVLRVKKGTDPVKLTKYVLK